jgi:hypothetical protein
MSFIFNVIIGKKLIKIVHICINTYNYSRILGMGTDLIKGNKNGSFILFYKNFYVITLPLLPSHQGRGSVKGVIPSARTSGSLLTPVPVCRYRSY